MRQILTIAGLFLLLSLSAQEKTLIDFFLAIQPQAELISDGIWGADSVLPRDTANGLEDATMQKWCYWDGGVVKDDKGLYHMYASHWDQEYPHSRGWREGSRAIHSVSQSMMGPYVETGLVYPQWKNSLGHNVVGLRTHDGRYAVVTSESTRGEIFISDHPNGPFELLGEIIVDANGFDPGLARYDKYNQGAVKNNKVGYMANVQILPRPDGDYLLIPRSSAPMLSKDGILGPYKIMGDKIYKDMPLIPQEKMEDPTVWYSAEMYHMVINYHGADSAYHFTSPDGIHDWKSRGLAFCKEQNLFKYTNGLINKWGIVQRMTVYVEDGHPRCFLFSVIDVHKGKDKANDEHGSKIIMLPFDGEAFDKHIKKVISKEQ